MKEGTHVIICTCGCDNGLVFRHCGELFVSAITGAFYSMQEGKRKWKRYKKGKALFESIVDKDDLRSLLSYLKGLKFVEPCSRQKNYSHIEIEDMGGSRTYSVAVMSDLPKKMIRKKKEFYAAEITLGEDDTNELIQAIEEVLEM